MSSCELLLAMRPGGGGLVVAGAGLEASVQDAGHPVVVDVLGRARSFGSTHSPEKKRSPAGGHQAPSLPDGSSTNLSRRPM
jgi:hypothetical protein